MSSWGFRPYVPVAQRRANALKEAAKLKKQGRALSPVAIEGRKIAKSFWGKAWCDNLERYSDYANRLPRGRTYVNNGSVIDLQIMRGKVEALVSGSEIYKVKVDIAVAAPARWNAICADCSGSIGSIVELLQGKLSKHVMERVCREADGLFPAPKEIKMSCSCPDWAGMCKHVAATLYGVGARLDHDPDVLFALRGVERGDLVSTTADLSITEAAAGSERVLVGDDVAALFGLEFETAPEAAAPRPTKARVSEGAKKTSATKATNKPEPQPAKPPAAKAALGAKPKRRLVAPAEPAKVVTEAATPKSAKASSSAKRDGKAKSSRAAAAKNQAAPSAAAKAKPPVKPAAPAKKPTANRAAPIKTRTARH